MKVGKLLPVSFVIFFLMSCAAFTLPAPSPTVSLPTATRTISLPSSTKTVTPRPPTETPTNTPYPIFTPSDEPLNQSGPWVIFWGADGLYAMNPNFSGVTRVHQMDENYYRNISSISPTGGHIAIYQEDRNKNGFEGQLVVIKIPQGQVIQTIEVRNPNLDPAEVQSPGESDWSPDGRTLAFISSTNGISSDLYIYSLDTGQITQLTDGPTQSAWPSWSTGGTYIFTQGVKFFGTGAGANIDTDWVTQINGESTDLHTYSPWHFWISDNEILTLYSDGCDGDLQYNNLETQQIIAITEPGHCFFGFAFNSFDNNILTSTDHGFSEHGVIYQPGTYLISGYTTWKRISEEVGRVAWSSRAGLYLLSRDIDYSLSDEYPILAFNSSGIQMEPPYPATNFPVISTDGSIWVWSNQTGTYIGTPTNPKKKILDFYSQIEWQPGTNDLFLCSAKNGSFIANAPEYDPMQINVDLDCYHTSNVWP